MLGPLHCPQTGLFASGLFLSHYTPKHSGIDNAPFLVLLMDPLGQAFGQVTEGASGASGPGVTQKLVQTLTWLEARLGFPQKTCPGPLHSAQTSSGHSGYILVSTYTLGSKRNVPERAEAIVCSWPDLRNPMGHLCSLPSNSERDTDLCVQEKGTRPHS